MEKAFKDIEGKEEEYKQKGKGLKICGLGYEMESKVLKKRNEILDDDKWKVNEVFESDEAWEEAYKKLQEEAPKLKDFEGKLNNGETLEKFLEFNEKVEIGRAHV